MKIARLRKCDLSKMSIYQLLKIKEECNWHVEWRSDGFTIVCRINDNGRHEFISNGKSPYIAIRNAIYVHIKCKMCLRWIKGRSKTFKNFEENYLDRRNAETI